VEDEFTTVANTHYLTQLLMERLEQITKQQIIYYDTVALIKNGFTFV